MKSLLTGSIKVYKKVISPFTVKSCRFYPSCSEYAVQAIEEQGVARGMLLAICRIARCNPFFKGGYDPVPKTKKR